MARTGQRNKKTSLSDLVVHWTTQTFQLLRHTNWPWHLIVSKDHGTSKEECSYSNEHRGSSQNSVLLQIIRSAFRLEDCL